MRSGANKWIVSNRYQWKFDRLSDPDERHPMPSEDDEEVLWALALLAEASGIQHHDNETRAWLKSLGYVD